MRRIVNILAKMVSAIVLALIFLPLLVALLFEIPAVQNFVAREATEIISRKLGTRISIDRVDIGLFYRVSLDGFYVDDFQRDTLLYAGRLDARIKSLGLFGEADLSVWQREKIFFRWFYRQSDTGGRPVQCCGTLRLQ